MKKYLDDKKFMTYVAIALVILMAAHFGLFYFNVTVGPISFSLGTPTF